MAQISAPESEVHVCDDQPSHVHVVWVMGASALGVQHEQVATGG
jgi:hypothetical protein